MLSQLLSCILLLPCSSRSQWLMSRPQSSSSFFFFDPKNLLELCFWSPESLLPTSYLHPTSLLLPCSPAGPTGEPPFPAGQHSLLHPLARPVFLAPLPTPPCFHPVNILRQAVRIYLCQARLPVQEKPGSQETSRSGVECFQST